MTVMAIPSIQPQWAVLTLSWIAMTMTLTSTPEPEILANDLDDNCDGSLMSEDADNEPADIARIGS
jgi:hypothetical protein